jgi:hypothetical protein
MIAPKGGEPEQEIPRQTLCGIKAKVALLPICIMRRIDELYLELVCAGRLAFFNTRRPHAALDRQTPDHVYVKSLSLAAA